MIWIICTLCILFLIHLVRIGRVLFTTDNPGGYIRDQALPELGIWVIGGPFIVFVSALILSAF